MKRTAPYKQPKRVRKTRLGTRARKGERKQKEIEEREEEEKEEKWGEEKGEEREGD